MKVLNIDNNLKMLDLGKLAGKGFTFASIFLFSIHDFSETAQFELTFFGHVSHVSKISEQQPNDNNDHPFWIPRIVNVQKFGHITYILH